MSFLRDNVALKLARGKASTDENHKATVDIKIPGVAGSEDGRVVAGGQGWFENADIDDYFKIFVVDVDGVLAPAGTVLGSYTDVDVDVDNQGVYVPKGKEYLEVNSLGTFGFIQAGLYLRIEGYKSNNTADTLRCNIIWGIRE